MDSTGIGMDKSAAGMDRTIAGILREATEVLDLAGCPSAKIDTSVLLCHVLDRPSSYLFTWPERELDNAQFTQFVQLLERRKSGEPVAYIIGYREFWSLKLAVEPSTLIPRPDTERLVELALEKLTPQSGKVLDLGTGTGAIALAIASECPAISVTGVDLKPGAVALANRNRDALALSNASFNQSSWFDNVEPGLKFDVIVSNPPYIDPQDPHLSQGDVRFEPASALTADDHGLADIREICKSSPARLVSNGWLLVEHGYDQGESVRDIFNHFGFMNVTTAKDYAGQDRVTLGCIPA